MRISDWSSDVCSSDLLSEAETLACFGCFYREDVLKNPDGTDHQNIRNFMRCGWGGVAFGERPLRSRSVPEHPKSKEIRKECSERSEERRVGKSVSVRVDLGGSRIIQNKNKYHDHVITKSLCTS